MGTLRRILAGTLIACLLGGLSVAVWAEDETSVTPTPVTGTVTQAWSYSAGTGYTGSHESMEDGVFVGLGIVDHQEVAWSDPRLPSDHWMRLDYRIFGTDEPDGVMTVTTSHLLIDEQGSWRGTGRAVEDADSRYSTYELVGDGAYAGLYALLQGTRGVDAHGPWDDSYEGYVFEGTLPAFPEPAEPLDTEGWQRLPFPSPPPDAVPSYPDPVAGVRVYDQAGVLTDETVASLEATIADIEERADSEIVVYAQVKPESDTPQAAERDAGALLDQWGIGGVGVGDGLVILLDLDESLCHGQVQLYAGPGLQDPDLGDEERQAIFGEDMLPHLRVCDLDSALLVAMDRIDAAMGGMPPGSDDLDADP